MRWRHGGYWNKPLETAEAIRPDGWLRTGDAAYADAEGYLFLVDRLKDMIVLGAENIYPAEVGNALGHHPAVREVAVIGVPSDRWGETVKAFIVLQPGRGRHGRVDRVRTRPTGPVQVPDVGRLRRHAAAQRVGQTSA